MDFEQQARMVKARRLAEHCRMHGMSARWVQTTIRSERKQLCDDAGVNPASAETWAVVIGLLGASDNMTEAQRTAYETAAHGEGGDPFAGLPS